MGEAIRGGDYTCQSVLVLDLPRNIKVEISLDGRNLSLVCNFAHVRRFDAKHAMTAGLKVCKKRSVIRADINDEIVFSQAEQCRGFTIQLCEVVTQRLRVASGVREFRREYDGRINH